MSSAGPKRVHTIAQLIHPKLELGTDTAASQKPPYSSSCTYSASEVLSPTKPHTSQVPMIPVCQAAMLTNGT